MEATHSHTYLRENWADAAFFFPPKSTLVVTNSSKQVTLNSKRWDDVILLDALVDSKLVALTRKPNTVEMHNKTYVVPWDFNSLRVDSSELLWA